MFTDNPKAGWGWWLSERRETRKEKNFHVWSHAHESFMNLFKKMGRSTRGEKACQKFCTYIVSHHGCRILRVRRRLGQHEPSLIAANYSSSISHYSLETKWCTLVLGLTFLLNNRTALSWWMNIGASESCSIRESVQQVENNRYLPRFLSDQLLSCTLDMTIRRWLN